MNIQIALQILLRLLPSILLLVTGLLVIKDPGMKKRWADLLYKAGSIRAGQREEPKIQEGVRIPFLVLSGLFLIWPILYYFRDSYAQTPINPVRPTPAPTKPPAVPTPAGTLMPGAAAPSVVPTPVPTASGIAPRVLH